MKMMSRKLFGFVLAAIMIVSSCQKTPDLEPETFNADLKKAQVGELDGKIIPGQYIVALNEFPGQPKGKAVGYADGISRAKEVIMGLMREKSIPADKLGFVYAFAIEGFSASLTDVQVASLLKDKRVKYVEPDQVISISGSQSGAAWGIDRVDQRDLPLNQTYTWEATGSGVTAYIIDTGILYGHTEFNGRASFGFDAFGETGDDGNGHGTHVAGTTGGTTYGVAKGVNLIAVRVLDNSGTGSVSGVVAGMDWVTSNANKPAVANMSLGGGASTTIDNAVTRLFNTGVPVVVAAGNNGKDAGNYSPARAINAYTVGATTSTDAKASYSNYGNSVNIFAPGSSIKSAWYTSNTATNTISGTSMASPHVAGGAALFLETNPTATPQQVYDALTTNSTKNKVTSSKTTNNHLLYTLGFGGTAPVNLSPVAKFTFTTSGLVASFNAGTSSDSDGSIVSYAWNFGDGSTGSGVTASRNYATAGTYSVTLTVTDNAGATGTTSQSVAVSDSSGGGITLSATGYKVQGRQRVDLKWTGANSSNIDIYRSGVKITTVSNSGSYTDKINKTGGGSYTYTICEAGKTTCSNAVTVTF